MQNTRASGKEQKIMLRMEQLKGPQTEKRKRIPPLRYWLGERVQYKSNGSYGIWKVCE